MLHILQLSYSRKTELQWNNNGLLLIHLPIYVYAWLSFERQTPKSTKYQTVKSLTQQNRTRRVEKTDQWMGKEIKCHQSHSLGLSGWNNNNKTRCTAAHSALLNFVIVYTLLFFHPQQCLFIPAFMAISFHELNRAHICCCNQFDTPGWFLSIQRHVRSLMCSH